MDSLKEIIHHYLCQKKISQECEQASTAARDMANRERKELEEIRERLKIALKEAFPAAGYTPFAIILGGKQYLVQIQDFQDPLVAINPRNLDATEKAVRKV